MLSSRPQPTTIREYVPQFAIAIAACAIILLGLSMAAISAARNAWPGPKDPSSSYLTLTTSIAFMGSGFAVLAAAWQAKAWTMSFSTLVLLISGTSLAQSVARLAGSDEGLSLSMPATGSALHGMELGTSFAFVCAALHLLIISVGDPKKSSTCSILDALSFLVFAFGAEGFIGNVLGAFTKAGENHVFYVASGNAAGLLLLSISLLELSWQRQKDEADHMRPWGPALMLLAVMVVDLLLPRGLGFGAAYIPLIFCGLWFSRPHMALVLAAVATVFGLAAPIAKAPDGMDWRVLANRMSVLAAMWFVAVVVFLRRRSEAALQQSEFLRIKAEIKNAHLASIVASSDDAIISKTIDGIITSWNVGAERLFGYSASEALGQHASLIIPRERLAEDMQILRRIRQGEKIEPFETVRRHKNGNQINCSVTTSPISDAEGRVLALSEIARDITAQKEAESQIKRYTRELELSSRELARTNQDLEDFAYTASHDLREPLRGISNNVQIIAEEHLNADEAALARTRRVKLLCKRMDRLIDDLLYFSRLSRRDIVLEQVNLNHVVSDVISSVQLREERGIEIRMPQILPNALCDRKSIEEVFRHLIENAIKFNDKEIKIIEVGFIPAMETHVGRKEVFYVKDNGEGIDAIFHEEIFRFSKRLKNEEESTRGAGTGLTLARKIIRLHKGRIWLESEPGVGTTFYFTLGEGIIHGLAA